MRFFNILFVVIFSLYNCHNDNLHNDKVIKQRFELIKNTICVNINFNDSIKGIFVLDNETGGKSIIDTDFLKNNTNLQLINSDITQLPYIRFNFCNKTFKDRFEVLDRKFESFASGIIGQEIFLSNIVFINFRDSTISLYDSLPNTKDYYKIPYKKLSNRDKSSYGIDVKGFYDKNNKEINTKFLVDLGFGGEMLINLSLFDKINHRIIKDGIKIDTTEMRNIYSKSKRRIYRRWYNIDNLSIADLRIQNSKCLTYSFFDGHYDGEDFWEKALYDGIIGIKFLKNYDVIFDYKNGYLYLKPINKSINFFKNKYN